MKKILIVANVAKEHILKFHVPLIHMLKESGWTVHVACAGEEEIPYCDQQWHMVYERNPLRFAILRGIVQLRRILKREKYDLVHCHTPTGGVVARLAALGLKDRPIVVYTVHGFHFYKGAPLVNWLVFFPVEWLLSWCTDCIVTIDEEDYQNAQKLHMGMKQLRLIHGVGVRLERYSGPVREDAKDALRKALRLEGEPLVLTYVAELLKNKNQTVLLRALKRIRQQRNVGVLLLPGPDHWNGYLEQEAQHLGVAPYVRFLGWRSDVRQILAVTNIYVASSLREGLPLNLIEAQCAGLPIVASENRGHRELVQNGENGFLVPPKDDVAFAEKVLQLYDDTALWERMAQAGQKQVKKFALEPVLEANRALYGELLGETPQPELAVSAITK